MPANNIFQIRRGTQSQWNSANPVLASGEPGYDITNNLYKIGDGVNNWNNLKSVLDITGNATISGVLSATSGSFNNLIVNGTGVSISGHTHTSSEITDFNNSVNGLVSGVYAPLNSPSFSGVPTVPTASSGTNTNQIASTSFVRNEISNLVSSAPSTLDTLNELADALGDDPNFATTVASGLANKAPLVHTHVSSDVTDFSSSVSGLLPSISGSGYAVTSFNNNVYTVSVTGVQPSGDYSTVGHTHTSSDIVDFNSSVSGLLQVTSILSGSGINVQSSGTVYTISVSGLINNPTNNRILTSRDNTTTGIDAESNLTFDGSVLSVSGNLIADTGNFSIIQLNTDNGLVTSQGQLGWNDTEGTVDIALTDTAIINIGEHEMYRIRNTTGNVLYKGQAVMASGVHANGIILPNLYTANGSVREIRFMGLVYENVNHNNNGYVIHFGHIYNIDTRGNVASNIAVGDETWNDGDILYVHPTAAGKLTNVEPKHSIAAAIVLDAANNGKIFVRPTSYGHLNDNHDVSVSGATNGQFLQYNSSTDYWVPSSSGNFSTLLVNGTGVSLSGHNHTVSDIIDFNSSVSGLLPSINGSGYVISYFDNNTYTISVSGLQSSGNYAELSGAIFTGDISGQNANFTNLTFDTFNETLLGLGNSTSGVVLSLGSGTVQTCTLTDNCIFTMPSGLAGQSFTLFLNTGSGNYTTSFSGVAWPAATPPTITITADKIDILSFIYDGIKWYGNYSQNYS